MRENLIKRSDAIATIEKRKAKIVSNYESDKWFRKMISEVEAIPSADRPQGEWIEFDTKWGRSLYYCTNCMETSEVPTAFGKPLYDFCPNCGARMKGADDEQTN